MKKELNTMKIVVDRKKTLLPFMVHRAPLENHLAYEKKGHWTQKEKLKYIIFLSYFKEKFTTKDKKKRFCRIFKVMSDFIKTRTHNQCRSHHQKMQKQRFEVDSIIKNVVSKYHPRVYQQLYDRYLVQIENLNLQDQEEIKMQNINQNSLKYSSEPNLDSIKIPSEGQIKQRLRTKPQFKKEKKQHRFTKIKFQEEAPAVLEKPNIKKRQLRMTQECEEDEREFQVMKIDHQNDFPPKSSCFIQQPKSLDFAFHNNFMAFKPNPEKQIPINYLDYMQSLEIKKIDCLNKATYHYSQMQIELANVAECEKQRSKFVQEQQKQMVNKQNGIEYGFSHFLWGFQNYGNSF